MKKLSKELLDLYRISVEHRLDHGCGGYSFEDGFGLYELVNKIKPKRILELGTALGYTSAIFASAAPEALIDTIEADVLHVKLAQSNFQMLSIDHRITIHQGDFQAVLVDLEQDYDLAFFDGYAPSIDILTKIDERLIQNGYLICANLGLAKASERKELLRTLGVSGRWKQVGLLENEATFVAQKIGS
jgi:predicted O-methyltransferase YrrM